MVAYHDHNERDKADGLLDNVETGATVLVVSDAGMPTINDPGLAIVRRAIERGLPVTCAPGPSAVLDALALSGLPTDRFCYEGFLPRKHSERMQHLRMLRSERRTIVFYETLHRIADSMDDLLESFGPDRRMALCRELTKDYEQIRRGTIGEIHNSVRNDPPRGEMVLVIEGASDEEVNENTPNVLSIEELAELAAAKAKDEGLRTPGPPACDTYSNSSASAFGFATNHRRNSGSSRAIRHSMSTSVCGSAASAGVNAKGGGGGSKALHDRACDARCVRALPASSPRNRSSRSA